MIKIRGRFLRKFNQDESENTLIVYKKFRNRTANELKKARKKYFQNYFMENGKNMKKLWTGIKSILANKNSIVSRIHKVKEKIGISTSDPSEMSNIFIDFFVNVGIEITKSIHHNPKSPTEYVPNRSSDSIILYPVTPFEVNETI